MLSKVFLLAPASALLGAGAFVAATVYLAFERCGSGCTGFLEGMSRTPFVPSSALVFVGLILGLACTGRRGREFAIGFAGASVAIAVVTRGEMLFLWGMPAPRGLASALAEQAAADDPVHRLAALSAAGFDERAGGALTYRVLDCVDDPAPQLPEAVASACGDLASSWEGYEGPDRFGAEDNGWRWGYRRTRTGFRVWVQPDIMTDRVDPQFEADENGRVLVQRRVGEPRTEYADPR
jgi:hypothetical protein